MTPQQQQATHDSPAKALIGVPSNADAAMPINAVRLVTSSGQHSVWYNNSTQDRAKEARLSSKGIDSGAPNADAAMPVEAVRKGVSLAEEQDELITTLPSRGEQSKTDQQRR